MARARLSIDLDAVIANWRALAAIAAPARCAAVVKADAYGLGAARVAPALAAAGARTFFVALPEEGIALREILGKGPVIYALNGCAADEVAALSAAAVRPVLNSPEQIADAKSGAGETPLPCALQLDAGMNRLGLEAREAQAVLDDPQGLDGLAPQLVMAHLSCSDSADATANAQERRAFEALSAHPRLRSLARSLAATGGVLLGPDFHYDLVRPGIGLYGGLPFADAQPVATLHAPVLQIRDVAVGEAVGYGGAWRAERPSRIATIAAGYADGLKRGLTGAATYKGRALPIVGRVSMDLVTLDATDAPALRPGDAVSLLDARHGVDALAQGAQTIGYEILTSLGRRYARRYVGGPAASSQTVSRSEQAS